MNGMTTTWIGRALSALFAAALFADGAVTLVAPEMIAPAMAETGFPLPLATVIGAIAMASAVLYAIPRTAVLGAILATGFFGGAICTHLRIGEIGSPPQFVALVLGALAWAGLYLRDARLRALLPLRT